MKRIHRPVLFSSLFVFLIVLSVLFRTVSSNAAGWIGPYYMFQGGGGGTSSLVGEWRFDEATGASVADGSGRGLNATTQNGPVWTSGRYRAGLRFDGVDDYVQVGAPPALVMTTAVSLSAWINPTGTSSAGLGIIVCKEGEYEIARFSDGTIRWAFANSAPGWNFIDTGFVAPLNQWTHLTLTYNNGQVKTYANGNLVHSYLGSGAIGDVATTMNDLRIGGRQAAAQHFMGFIDEVSIYNQTLTAADAQKLAQGSMPRNLALGKPATQSSTGWDSPASRAVDGNTDADWYHGSVSHTNQESQAWWQVDLGSIQQIENVSLWMMSTCCSTYDNFDVKVSSDGNTWTSYFVAGPTYQTTVAVNRAARYVRVQLRGTGYLALAEVQVLGVPGAVMPGLIQAEDFDNGGEGISYHDLTAANEGGQYRTTAVDISTCSANNYVLGWNGGGEWTQYSINVPTAGNYTFQAVYGVESATGNLHVEIDGVNRTGVVTVPATGGWCTLQTISKGGISLTPGQHMLRVVTDNVGIVLDSFRLVAETTPNAATFVSQSVPTSMVAGQTYNVSVTMLNSGSNTWTTSGAYRLGTQNPQDNSIWGVTRVPLPSLSPITPGQQVTFAFPITAPATAGAYNFQTRMVQDPIEWFGALSSNVVVTVTTANQLPKAVAGGSSVSMVGVPVQFSSAGSSDPDGTIASYAWNFGNGQTSSDANPSHTYSAGGNYVVTLTVTDNAGATATATTTVSVIETTQSAYSNGVNSRVPGTIQAEDFDNGGPEIAYHDDSIGNLGGSNTYRADENVDIENNTATTGGYAVSWARAGEWLEYIVQVGDTDKYIFEARVAPPSGGSGGVFHVEIDGNNVSGPITVPNTGGAWTTVSKPGIKLSSGPHVIRIVMDSGGSSGFVGRFDHFSFTGTQSPYGAEARPLPGNIEAEDFDEGEQGTAYSDTTPGNQGGAYRNTDVDIWNSSEGPALGLSQKGEWTDYTVNVAQSGRYTVAARVSSPGDGAKFHLEVDGFDATGPIDVPSTGGRDVWQTVNATLKITAGHHILRLVIDEVGSGGEVCFNRFEFPSGSKGNPPADALIGPGEKFTDVDYTTVGIGNLLSTGGGVLPLRNTSNVDRAYLYWWGTLGFFNPQIVNFANRQIVGTPMATSNPGSFIFGSQSFTFRADVTGIIRQFGNVNYGLNTVSCYGASLVVIYKDNDGNNNRDIILYTGNDSNFGPFLDDEPGWNSTLTNINYPGSGQAILQLHVAEGEPLFETALVVRNAFNVANVYPVPFFDPPGADIFRGDTVPPNVTSGLWDIINFDVTRLLIGGNGNILTINAGLRRDVLFIALAVINVPHPPTPPSVNITDAKPVAPISGPLGGTTRNALAGGQIMLRATGNSTGGKYEWSFTGPVDSVQFAKQVVDNDTVIFRTRDDGSVPQKNVFPVTAKVTFTNANNAKADATVNINAHVPTLPVYRTTQSAVTLEQASNDTDPPIIWQIGRSNPIVPAAKFHAEARIPAGPYLSDLSTSNLHFEQNINTMRKVRDVWGRTSCKTSRFTLNDNDIETGWRGDQTAALSFPTSNKEFNGAFIEAGGLTLIVDLLQGVEGFKFKMEDVDAAQVDDKYETYVVYQSGNFFRRLGSVKWGWGGKMVFDTTGKTLEQLPPPDTNAYKLHMTNAPVGDIPRDSTVSSRTVNAVNSDLAWRPCPADAHPQPTQYRLYNNQHHYVAQLYEDFYQRDIAFDFEDAEGWYHWSSTITKNGFDEGAIAYHHINVALAFLFANDPDLVQLFPDLTRERHTPEYNSAFLLACYFGFLQRPADQAGFNHWITIMNGKNHLRDDSTYFEMVSAFLDSIEYKQRDEFEPFTRNPVTENYDNPAPVPPQIP